MSYTATRNRQIKLVLAKAFGRDAVRVSSRQRSSWSRVHIDYTPRDLDQDRELRQQCWALLRAAKVDIGRTYTDDTCQSTMPEVTITFERSSAEG